MAFIYGIGTYGTGLYSAAAVYNQTGSFAITAVFQGGLGQPVDVQGTMPLTLVFAAGAPAIDYAVLGSMTLHVTLSGAASSLLLGKGNLNVIVGAAAAPTAGPLWQPDTPCPISVWGVSEPCHG